jgi:hypothetical protein
MYLVHIETTKTSYVKTVIATATNMTTPNMESAMVSRNHRYGSLKNSTVVLFSCRLAVSCTFLE